MAGDIVPLDAVGVEVVQHSQADLVAITVVRLRTRRSAEKESVENSLAVMAGDIVPLDAVGVYFGSYS